MRKAAVLGVLATLALAGCSGPGADATFDPDAPGADAASDEETSSEGETSRPVVRGREESVAEAADLGAYAERACERAVTPSGRYSQTGYDRGVREGVEAGLDEDELVAAIDEACGDEMREAQGD